MCVVGGKGFEEQNSLGRGFWGRISLRIMYRGLGGWNSLRREVLRGKIPSGESRYQGFEGQNSLRREQGPGF